MRERYDELDILRVTAISYIILVRHIDDYASEMYQSPLVADFTVISLGILIYMSGYLLIRINSTFTSYADLKEFILKRFIRIYPLYALSLLLFYFLSLINIKQFVSGLLLLNLFVGEYILTLWYVSLIMTFYLLFAFVNYKYDITKTLCMSAVIFIILIIERMTFGIFDSALILYFPSFICGILSKYLDNVDITKNNGSSGFVVQRNRDKSL